MPCLYTQNLINHIINDCIKQLIQKIIQKEKKLNESTKDPVKKSEILEKKPWDRTILCSKYKFEPGSLGTFSEQFQSWWKKHYQYPGSPVKNVKIRLSPRTNYTLLKFLIHKKSHRNRLRP